MSEQIEGRNAVLEAFRSGKCVDKLFVLDRSQDGPVRTIIREARKKDTIINFVQKERLDQFFPLATTFLKCYAFRQEDPFILLGIDHLLAQLYDHFFITRLHLHHIPHTNPPFIYIRKKHKSCSDLCCRISHIEELVRFRYYVPKKGYASPLPIKYSKKISNQ